MRHIMKIAALFGTFILTAMLSTSTMAETWGVTEIQLQLGGEFDSTGAPGKSTGTVTTFLHAGGWEYGDNFFFINHSSYAGKNGLADSKDLYGEWYSNFSLGAITGKDLSFGPIKDIGIVAGVNYAPDVDSTWALPGVNLALDLPGFAFATLNLTAFIHASGADTSLAGDFNAPFSIIDEGNSFMVDFAWAYPFKLGATSWNLEGHLEYVDGNRKQVSNFGTTELESWVLFQPQLRLDIGELMGTPSNRLFTGLKYQYWRNKLGVNGVNDNALEFIAIWRF